jgi:hypothetical protein
MTRHNDIQKCESHERDLDNHSARGLHPSPPDQRKPTSETREPVVGGWSMR